MIVFLKWISNIINCAHDAIVDFVDIQGYNLTDKALHFIIIAIFGMALFAGVHFVFKFLAKHSITAISFIYTLTVLIVVVFAIEIQQKITDSGQMDFADIAYGLYGFLCAFGIYVLVKLIRIMVKKLRARNKNKITNKENEKDEIEDEEQDD
jgi:glycopeptide antibiotics resistance protein